MSMKIPSGGSARAPEREPRQRRVVLLRHRIMNKQAGHQRLGVRDRHARTQVQAPRRLIDRGDHPLIATSGCGKPPFRRRRRSVAQLGRDSETTRRMVGLHSKAVGFRPRQRKRSRRQRASPMSKFDRRPGR